MPISVYSKGPGLLYETEQCGIKAYIIAGRMWPLVKGFAEQVAGLSRVVSLDADDKLSPEQLFSSYFDVENTIITPVDVAPEHPATIFYTSGSTGKPKGVTHTHSSYFANAEQRCTTLHHDSTHTFLTTTFLCHAAASTIALLPILHAGGTAIFLSEEVPELIFNLLQAHPVTHMGATPVLWQEIYESPLGKKEHFANIQYATCGGNAVSPALLDGIQTKYDLTLTIGLGMTECGGYLITPPDLAYKQGALGKPLHGAEVRLVDELFNDVADDVDGQNLVRGKNVFAGYWQDPDNTGKAFYGDWFITGDLGRRDKDGYYYFSGRCKNIIVHDSSNITPEAVEHALNSHPKVQESLVVGVPDASYGQNVFAFIQPCNPNQPPSVAELTAHILDQLAERKVPAYYCIENLHSARSHLT